MKNIRNMMLIALVAAAMVALPQDLQAQERKPKAQVEMRDRREQRNPERVRAMRDKDFSMMYKIVKKASFNDNRIDIIRVAAIGIDKEHNGLTHPISILFFLLVIIIID